MQAIQVIFCSLFTLCLLMSLSDGHSGPEKSRPRSRSKSRTPRMKPIKLAFKCEDEACCGNVNKNVDVMLTFTPKQPQPQPRPQPRRVKILDLLNATANSEDSDFTFIATEENSQLLESVGLQSNDECAWKISVDNRKVPSLKYRVRSGQTVMFSYEAVEEENLRLGEESGSGEGSRLLEEKTSKPDKKTKSRTPRRKPIKLAFRCEDEACCGNAIKDVDVEFSFTPKQPQPGPQPHPQPHRISILDLLNATANSEVSDFTFTVTEENSQLLESDGLQSNDECAWKISVDNRKVPSLKYRVRSGQTVMVSYEAMEEENSRLGEESGSGEGLRLLEEKTSKPDKKTKSRTPRMGPIVLEINCDVEACCTNTTTPVDVKITLEPNRTRRFKIIDLLNAVVNQNGSDYNFSASEKPRQRLMEFAGMPNSEKCMWKVSVGERNVPSRRSLRMSVQPGQTVSVCYEERTLQDDKTTRDEDGPGEKTSKSVKKSKKTNGGKQGKKNEKEPMLDDKTMSDEDGTGEKTSKSIKKSKKTNGRKQSKEIVTETEEEKPMLDEMTMSDEDGAGPKESETEEEIPMLQ